MESSTVSWKAVAEWSSENRIYKWLSVSLPNVGKKRRRKILEGFLEDFDAKIKNLAVSSE